MEELLELAERQYSLFSTEQAAGCEVSYDALFRAARRGRLLHWAGSRAGAGPGRACSGGCSRSGRWPRATAKDFVRQNALVPYGWHVLRFTWWQVVNQPEVVAGAIRAALAGLEAA
jgi:hypothetical protein